MRPLIFMKPLRHNRDLLEEKFGPLDKHREAPAFWVNTPERSAGFLDSLTKATKRVIGKSVSGRDILALEYGAEEPMVGVTSESLHSSIACQIAPCDPTRIFPESFYGSGQRERPVLVLQGGIHGGEYTGTVAALNLCAIMETGKDLRGKAWPELERLARGLRIIVIPWLNPDAAWRWEFANPEISSREAAMANTHGIAPNGDIIRYENHKAFWPLGQGAVGFLGTYFNDAGVNLQYDVFQEDPQPETRAWMSYYRTLRPDAVVVYHCNDGTLIGPPEYYLPEGHQHLCSRIGGAVHNRLLREGLFARRLSWADLPGMGKPFFNQISAIYHVSGALPLMIELPYGFNGYTCEKLLDAGLLSLEEIFYTANIDGLRPYMTRAKRKK